MEKLNKAKVSEELVAWIIKDNINLKFLLWSRQVFGVRKKRVKVIDDYFVFKTFEVTTDWVILLSKWNWQITLVSPEWSLKMIGILEKQKTNKTSKVLPWRRNKTNLWAIAVPTDR